MCRKLPYSQPPLGGFYMSSHAPCLCCRLCRSLFSSHGYVTSTKHRTHCASDHNARSGLWVMLQQLQSITGQSVRSLNLANELWWLGRTINLSVNCCCVTGFTNILLVSWYKLQIATSYGSYILKTVKFGVIVGILPNVIMVTAELLIQQTGLVWSCISFPTHSFLWTFIFIYLFILNWLILNMLFLFF